MSLKTRTITGLTFGAVMIGGILYSYQSCAILFVMIAALCLWELSTHVLIQDGSTGSNSLRQALFITIGMFFPVLTLLAFILEVEWAFRLALLFPVFAFSLFLFELTAKSAKPFDNVAFAMLGVVYIALPFSLLIHLTSPYFKELNPGGNHFILATIFMVWASDVFAYLLGSKIGKHKMFPRISPKKTWEGTFSGVAGAILTGYLCSLIFTESLDFPLPFWIGMAIICTTFGILGDLVESMLKRSLGIKDSGNLLPGHGGFLDRFDAFIFVLPFVYTYVIIWFNLL